MLMSIRYNFRNPQPWARDSGYLYNRILDQIEWADQVGFDRITFAEHHFLDEGFLPAWMPMMAAVAARTRRVLLGAEILLLPLHHPVRLAEGLEGGAGTDFVSLSLRPSASRAAICCAFITALMNEAPTRRKLFAVEIARLQKLEK